VASIVADNALINGNMQCSLLQRHGSRKLPVPSTTREFLSKSFAKNNNKTSDLYYHCDSFPFRVFNYHDKKYHETAMVPTVSGRSCYGSNYIMHKILDHGDFQEVKKRLSEKNITYFQAVVKNKKEIYIKIGDEVCFVFINGNMYVRNQDIVPARGAIPARQIFQLVNLVPYTGSDSTKQGKSYVYFKAYKHCEFLSFTDKNESHEEYVWTYDTKTVIQNTNIKKRYIGPDMNMQLVNDDTVDYVIKEHQPLLRAMAFHATFNPFINRVWAADMTLPLPGARSHTPSSRRRRSPTTPHPTPRQASLAAVPERSPQLSV
jgi:hypothetical protein